MNRTTRLYARRGSARGIARGRLAVILACFAQIACAPMLHGQPGGEPAAKLACPALDAADAVAPSDGAGPRRLALLVGVGKYANPEVDRLDGPATDVRGMHALLTGPDGYGFRQEDVCVLLDEQATTSRFKKAWDKALVERARPGDIAVFFFAGHGSQARDWNDDEPDGYDETVMLHDARHQGRRDLLDDELNGLVARLYDKTPNVTMILDSCNSGSASRGGSHAKARFFDRLDDEPAAGAPAASGDGGEGWRPESMPGLVVMSGARDGTSAMEVDGAGVFTQSLLEVLGEASGPLTYAQVSHRTPRRIAAQSQQVAYFQGALDRVVFGATERKRPASWVVRALEGDRVRLQGVPRPGWSRGALLRVHSGSATAEEVRDPATARGYLEIAEIGGFEARASYVIERGEERPKIEEGDLAVLVQAGLGSNTISVRLRPAGEEGGLSEREIADIEKQLCVTDPEDRTCNQEAAAVIDLSESGGFEVARGASGRGYRVFGPEGRLRNTNRSIGGVIENLSNHADQKAFLGLRADPGSIFVNDETLKVRIVPASWQNRCAQDRWLQAAPGELQLIPMCHRWEIEVTLDESSPKSLLVGGVVLWNDGGKVGFPAGNERVLLGPGETQRFTADEGEAFESLPPLGVPEHVLVFGTQEDNPVDWGTIRAQATTRGPGERQEEEEEKKEKESALAKLVAKFFKGKRGGRSSKPTGGALQPWTSTHVTIRAEANLFVRPDPGELSGGPAELAAAFALPALDLRPYAPIDKKAGLYAALEEMAARSDPEAAATGPVEAVFDAFAEAGLALPEPRPGLAELADPGSSIARFSACEMTAARAGDLVVQRAPGAGHVAMVLDPEARVVWGALGWDGAASAVPGVGFHHQRSPSDWALLGVEGMRQAACWRYERFAADAADPNRRPGSRLPFDGATVCGDGRGGGCPSNRLFR